MCAECHLAKQFSRGDRTRNAAESEILLAFKHHNENIGDSMVSKQQSSVKTLSVFSRVNSMVVCEWLLGPWGQLPC